MSHEKLAVAHPIVGREIVLSDPIAQRVREIVHTTLYKMWNSPNRHEAGKKKDKRAQRPEILVTDETLLRTIDSNPHMLVIDIVELLLELEERTADTPSEALSDIRTTHLLQRTGLIAQDEVLQEEGTITREQWKQNTVTVSEIVDWVHQTFSDTILTERSQDIEKTREERLSA